MNWYFQCNMVSLNLCQEYLNVAKFNILVSLLINSWTVGFNVFNVYAGLNLPPGNSQRQKLRNVIAEHVCAVIGRLACCAKTCIGNRKKRPWSVVEDCSMPALQPRETRGHRELIDGLASNSRKCLTYMMLQENPLLQLAHSGCPKH